MGFAPFDQTYPWDLLDPYRERAAAHPEAVVDLSIGTPVDPTPDLIQEALRAAADAPGYPLVTGTPQLREALVDWWARRRNAHVTEAEVLATIGSKELVGLLPSLVGITAGDAVVVPTMAYPTYEVGARLAGAEVIFSDTVADWAEDPRVKLVWLNSPSNPTGEVLGAPYLREVIAAARNLGAIVASDECYAELAWTEPWVSQGVPSVLSAEVCDGDHSGLVAAYSLSKQSNLAGYRAAFIAGDAEIIGRVTQLRRHLGMMVAAPVQTAMTVALNDDAHVAEQRGRYARRRQVLLAALVAAGFEIDHSEAGLYLWARLPAASTEVASPQCWELVGRFSDLGIVVGPGEFYGAAAQDYVRLSLTASDELIAAAADRLRQA